MIYDFKLFVKFSLILWWVKYGLFVYIYDIPLTMYQSKRSSLVQGKGDW